jgi:hypothetical protein
MGREKKLNVLTIFGIYEPKITFKWNWVKKHLHGTNPKNMHAR